MEEEWKIIDGFPRYAVSNYGNVKKIETNHILKLRASTWGYYQICLYDHGYHYRYIHKLVAEVFIPNPDNKSMVNHIDGNKLNNVVTNLEWCTQSENNKHAFDSGLKTKTSQGVHPLILDSTDNIVFDSYKNASDNVHGNIPGLRYAMNSKRSNHMYHGHEFAFLEIGNDMITNIELYSHQIDAVKRLGDKKILDAPVGAGKSRIAITYYYFKVCNGSMKINGKGKVWKPKNPTPLYIITTARKRDTHEWEDELNVFGIKAAAIDSWNNIKKYVAITDAFFIWDEDRVVGSGSWVKSFLKIAKRNRWILLSATPGDSWQDYIPVFIANGFYKNRTEFNHLHTVYKPYMKFPIVDHYINTEILENYRRQVLVIVDYQKKAVKENHKIIVNYDKELYKRIFRDRWDIFDDEPVMEAGKLCYLLRKIVNIDNSRIEAVRDLLIEHPKAIIFYNFTYELNILRELATSLDYEIGEWNGEVHSAVPVGSRWVYLAQYTAASEGWNCITTDTTIFYSQSYSYRTTTQAAGRIDRLNTPFSVLHYYYIRSAAPIDLAIARALNQKKDFNARAYVGGFNK